MTKEKIIDGIDVSDCMYYEPKALKMTCHEQAITKPCNTSPICYYKLLHKAYKNCERLEQENERLREELNKYEERYEELYKNSEQLVKKYNKYDGKKENELIEVINKTTDLKNKYKQTLQEIKAIAETGMHCEGMGCDFMPQILDLITKAEEE